jgi:hypothetical protein
MKTTTNKTVCTCGNFGCPVRIARGLEPFCGVVKASGRDSVGVFTSYAAAVAASPVGRARWISGGGTTGAPARFLAEGYKSA